MNSAASSSTSPPQSPPPKMYLVIVNIQKLTNVKALMMTAAAFGCEGVLLVGQDKNSQKKQHNKIDSALIPKAFEQAVTNGKIQLEHFPKWKDCLEYVEQQDIYMVGVEIDETSQVLDDDYAPPASQRKLAIVMGNEGQGIHPKHLEACRSLIRIPQYGQGTASFNVNVAASIALHHFHRWARKQTTTATE